MAKQKVRNNTVRVNVSRMFAGHEPYNVSNSVANLGDHAGRLTWNNATSIAESWRDWLRCGLRDTCDAVRLWARDTGAWSDAEVNAWKPSECLALLAQNVASDMRENGYDDAEDDKAWVRDLRKRQEAEDSDASFHAYRSTKHGVVVDFYLGS
jgi:hypothetical protein